MRRDSEEGLRNSALYVYCLYQGGGSLPVHGRAQAGLPELVGIDGNHKVFTLSRGGINAAVSSVPLQEFGTGPLEQRMGDLGWVSQRVCIHERVIEQIMTAHPVMPMRFCTIFADNDMVEELLKVHHTKIIRFFSDNSGKEEWGVKGYMDGGRFQEAQKRLSPALAAGGILEEEASPGQAYLLRKKRELAMKDGLSGVVAQAAEEVFRDLLASAAKGVRNKVAQLKEVGTREELILNAAFLIAKRNVRIFRGKVEKTEEKYCNQGLSLSVTGPWPPYHFCPVFGDESPSG